MVEKRFALVAALIALTIVGAPLAASATPISNVKTIGVISFHTEDEEDHDDDEDEDEDDDHHGSIPPVFVVPGAKKPHHDHPRPPASNANDTSVTSINPLTGTTAGTTAIDPLTGEEFVVVGAGEVPSANSLGGVNPEELRAIDIKLVSTKLRSPADQFLDTAYIGMGMLGVAALGLGVTAGVRAIRLRRSGKSDYFYSDK